jgi:tetratricopeptide (TPR) repeat protein
MARGDLDRSAERSVESLELARSLGVGPTAAVALTTLGAVAERRGDLDRAAELYDDALEVRRGTGDRRTTANALLNLGRAELVRGRDAQGLLEEGLALAEEVGDTWGVSLARSSLAHAALRAGDGGRARELWTEALTSCFERGDRRTAAECLLGLAAATGDARLAGAADALRESLGAPPSPFERSLEDEVAADPSARKAGRRLDLEAAVGEALAPQDR